MGIPSQALWQHNEGVTTTVRSPKRTVKQQERGKNIKKLQNDLHMSIKSANFAQDL